MSLRRSKRLKDRHASHEEQLQLPTRPLSRFERLPAEIKLEIYRYALANLGVITGHADKNQHALLLVSKEIYSSINQVFHTQNSFQFVSFDSLRRFCKLKSLLGNLSLVHSVWIDNPHRYHGDGPSGGTWDVRFGITKPVIACLSKFTGLETLLLDCSNQAGHSVYHSSVFVMTGYNVHGIFGPIPPSIKPGRGAEILRRLHEALPDQAVIYAAKEKSSALWPHPDSPVYTMWKVVDAGNGMYQVVEQ